MCYNWLKVYILRTFYAMWCDIVFVYKLIFSIWRFSVFKYDIQLVLMLKCWSASLYTTSKAEDKKR